MGSRVDTDATARLRLRLAAPLGPRNASDMDRTDLDASADYHFAMTGPLTKISAREIPHNGVPG